MNEWILHEFLLFEQQRSEKETSASFDKITQVTSRSNTDIRKVSFNWSIMLHYIMYIDAECKSYEWNIP